LESFSIEFAHIYIDEKNIRSHGMIPAVKDITISIGEKGLSYSLALLIDDYNPTRQKLNIDKYLSNLEHSNVMPDFVLFESELVKLKEPFFELINEGKAKRSYLSYISNKEGHIPCSLLISVWYFLRLGLLDYSYLNFYHQSKGKGFVGNELINVLQLKYKGVEKKAIDIISNSKFPDKQNQIQNVYVKNWRRGIVYD